MRIVSFFAGVVHPSISFFSPIDVVEEPHFGWLIPHLVFLIWFDFNFFMPYPIFLCVYICPDSVLHTPFWPLKRVPVRHCIMTTLYGWSNSQPSGLSWSIYTITQQTIWWHGSHFPTFPYFSQVSPFRVSPGPGRHVELYPDTDDEMQWPPTAAYLPPRQCPATEFLESLMCAWVEISGGF